MCLQEKLLIMRSTNLIYGFILFSLSTSMYWKTLLDVKACAENYAGIRVIYQSLSQPCDVDIFLTIFIFPHDDVVSLGSFRQSQNAQCVHFVAIRVHNHKTTESCTYQTTMISSQRWTRQDVYNSGNVY